MLPSISPLASRSRTVRARVEGSARGTLAIPWGAAAAVAWGLLLLIATAGPSWPISPEEAFAHLTRQCAMGPRNPGSPGHERCAAYIQEVLEACGGRVTLQRFDHKAPGLPETVELTNITGRFGPRRAGGLLLGTHWDTRPWADQDPDSTRHACQTKPNPQPAAREPRASIRQTNPIPQFRADNPTCRACQTKPIWRRRKPTTEAQRARR